MRVVPKRVNKNDMRRADFVRDRITCARFAHR